MKAAKHGLADGAPIRQLVQRDIGRHRDSRPEASRHLDKIVHDAYFHPAHEEFNPRTMWSLSNAFTTAFKDLDPIPQFKATGKLAPFLAQVK
jgi:hypothetical protein